MTRYVFPLENEWVTQLKAKTVTSGNQTNNIVSPKVNFPYTWYVLVPKQNERKNCQDRFYFGSRNKSVYRLQIKKTTKTKSLETEAKAILIMLIKIHQKKLIDWVDMEINESVTIPKHGDSSQDCLLPPCASFFLPLGSPTINPFLCLTLKSL